MSRLIMLTLPAIGAKVPSRPIIINVDNVRDICPRYVQNPDLTQQADPWVETGTWINNGESEGSTFHVVESFEFVMQQLIPTKVMKGLSRG